jgi:ketosteroid isomerase-like protein
MSAEDDVREAMENIQSAWRENRARDMIPHLHPDVVMALPGFAGVIKGRHILVTSFVEFSKSARVLQYGESNQNVEVVGDTAIVTFEFQMTYERGDYRGLSKGRDCWVFARDDDRWLAVWRTMMDVSDNPVA